MIKHLKRRHEKHYKGKPFHLFADIFFVIAIILLIVAFFVLKNWQPRSVVSVTVSGSDKIISGALNSFVFNYKANKDINNNSLNLKLPDNFVIKKVDPIDSFDTKSNSFAIPNLSKGQSGEIKVEAVILGELNKNDALFSSFNCNTCGAGILSYLNYEINDSVLTADLELPNKIYNGIEFGGKLFVKNNGVDTLNKIKIEFDKQLQLKSSDHTINNNVFFIDKIDPGQVVEIGFSAISANGIGDKNVGLTTYLTVNNKELRQNNKNFAINVAESNFKITAAPDKNVARAEEKIKYTVNFQNQENSVLSDVKFNLISGNDDFEVNSVNIVESDKKTSLNDKNIILLDKLNPGDSGKIVVAVTYKRLKINNEVELPLDVLTQYKINEQSLRYHLISDKIKILSSVKASAVVRYYSQQGDQLGVGPIPPMVDMATKYWVFWEVNNKGNDLDVINFKAELPKNVIWTDNKSLLSGGLNYNSASGKISWQMEDISKSGEEIYKIGFEIGIIPEATDIGKPITLLKNVEYSAHDKFCDQLISGKLADFDTRISDTHFGANNGLVVPNE